MLTHIKVSQFAIVDELELDVPGQLSVITGETGAGKSIMLDALGLALGNRADSDMVRHGAGKAEIHAVFDIQSNTEAIAWLKAQDLLDDDQNSNSECFLRRVINRDGRSKAYINGSPMPLTAVRELGKLLVTIHGQHEHQALLKKEAHCKLLDQYGQLSPLAAKVRQQFLQWRRTQKTLQEHQQSTKERQDRADLLKFQLQEFEQLNLQPGEYQQLEQQHKKLANTESLLSAAQQALLALSEQEDSANQQVRRGLQLIQDMHKQDAQLAELSNLVESASIQLEEACDSLRHYMSELDTDPEHYQQLDQRLSLAYQLARKHRIDPYELCEFHQQIQQELDQLDNSEEHLQQLAADEQEAEQVYRQLAAKLSKKRQACSNKLSQQISAQIQQLGMPNAGFEAALQALPEDSPAAHGLEDVEFIVQTNPGQPAKPLGKIASGGELSRISLAIQVACAQTSNTATLMFDEVDVGIGGGTAQIVGQLLAKLGGHSQVICVTHQPQVAAQGHHHFVVSKITSKQQTSTQINALNQDEKINEVARMLGGIEISKQTLAHAKELIQA